MDNTLGYLRESLSNYIEEHKDCERMFKMIEENDYESEEAFIRELNDKEVRILETILKNEIEYAKQEQDVVRTRELNEVYESLF